MDHHVIFGSDIKLPSIEGVESECEDALYLLMKEIDLAFERKHKLLLQEVMELRTKCRSKDNDLTSLKLNLKTQASKKTLEEHNKYLVHQIAKLKEENIKLMEENRVFQNSLHDKKEYESQLDCLTRTQEVHQEENSMLKDRLNKLHAQHSSLQENYQKLLQLMSSDKSGDAVKGKAQATEISTDFIDALIARETEKYMKEESDRCSELQEKIDKEIEQMRLTLQDQNAYE